MARFNLIPAYRGTAQNGKETLQNTLNEPKPYQMNAKSFSKKDFPQKHNSVDLHPGKAFCPVPGAWMPVFLWRGRR